MPGEIVSFVGRPAAGKTWAMLKIAINNWAQGKKVLFVSMEMALLPICQRIASMYTGCTIQQLKTAAFSEITYNKFHKNIKGMFTEPGKLYVINGALAATVEDIYMLADQLGCSTIVIDGGYLVRHKNKKLDRFNRVAENCELMKIATESLGTATR